MVARPVVAPSYGQNDRKRPKVPPIASAAIGAKVTSRVDSPDPYLNARWW